MKDIFGFLTELAKSLRLYATSSKTRATTKALVVATRIQRLDERVAKLRNKKTRTAKDISRIKIWEKKKLNLWRSFDHYIAIN